jgi:hypothetical protein
MTREMAATFLKRLEEPAHRHPVSSRRKSVVLEPDNFAVLAMVQAPFLKISEVIAGHFPFAGTFPRINLRNAAFQ